MLKIILVAVLAIGSQSLDLEKISGADFTDFLSGFALGLGNGQSNQCSQSVSNIINLGYKVSKDFKMSGEGLQGEILTLNDMQSFMNSLNSVKLCNIAGLHAQIDKIFSKDGWEILVNNYLANGASVFSDYNTILNCDSNYSACGTAAGNAFKLLIGWSLN